jgi:amidase
MLDVLSGPVPGDADTAPPPERPFVESARSDPGKLRIAWSVKAVRGILPPIVTPDVHAAAEETAGLLSSLGHDVEQANPKYGQAGNPFVAHYLRGIHDEAVTVPHQDRLESRTRGFSRIGGLVSKRAIARAKKARVKHAARVNAIFDDFDVLVTPVCGEPPIEIGRWEKAGAMRTLLGMSRTYPFAGIWNLLGNPAASVPATLTGDGAVGALLIGRPNDEATLLSLAAQIEAERPWAGQRPPAS